MSGAVEGESVRARPLSGGLWTLFSWLRRDDHSSTESVSSAGSDRTALSFAFLPPTRFRGSAPGRLSPPPPPSDSYRRRVRERSLRRQRDRDLTLHRKYGLYGLGFDASSLPLASAHRQEDERDRRAASECPRAHVPGKRRAPPPPAVSATLPRRRARKRPAPLPPAATSVPADPTPRVIDVAPMNPLPNESLRGREDAIGCKPEKYSKKEIQQTKEVKLRSEKSFLKQIFENKKRNSTIDTGSVKLLPNISELDKQAAEMIEKYRLKEMPPIENGEKEIAQGDLAGSSKRQTEAWICTRCLKKYDSSVITCNYCLPLNKLLDSYKSTKISNSYTKTKDKASGSASGNIEDKEKLKEMLKEIKDSLPKRPKSELIFSNKSKNSREIGTKGNYPKICESATLRIGSSNCMDKEPATPSTSDVVTPQTTSQSTTEDINKPSDNLLTTINSVIITQPVVLLHTKENVVLNESKTNKENSERLQPIKLNNAIIPTRNIFTENLSEIEKGKSADDLKPLNIISKTKHDLNTPLKISSLLNPIYIPKATSTTNTQTQSVKPAELKYINKEKPKTASIPESNTEEIIRSLVVPPPRQIKITTPQTDKDKKLENETKIKLEFKRLRVPLKATIPQVKLNEAKPEPVEVKSNNNFTNVTLKSTDGPSTSKEVDQHARRRDLINQLERSIARGDEQAAAEAAVKLAQLKLSCSVLSFSSQIVAAASGSSIVTTPQPTTVLNLEDNSINVADPDKPAPGVFKPKDDKLDKKEPVTSKEDKSVRNQIEIPNFPNLKSVRKTQQTTAETPAPDEASTSKEKPTRENDEEIPILIWVEDKDSTRGPVQLHVRRGDVMGELRRRAELSLGLPARMQRWIVGRTLCSDDNTPLLTLAGPELSAPFYLCLVESDTKPVQKDQIDSKPKEDPENVYNELVKLEKQALVSNAETFDCGVCIETCLAGHGVVLRECVHSFCKECLSDVVRHSEEPAVSCPAMGCLGFLQEREIRGLVSPDDYEKWLARGLAAAESGSRNAFHCRTRDCTGWAMCDPGVRRFPCPVCKHTNCVPCQAIHEGVSCEQHRATQPAASSDASQTDEGTRALLASLISRGEAVECPECSAIITKKWGCDWIKCSACKTEICWVTRGRRWGPAGRGDTSAGCRCGVDNKRCHPSCGYCH